MALACPRRSGLFREWLTAAPSPTAWHDSLAVLALLGNANTALKLDIYRLMRAAGAMTRESDFIELSQAANEARAYGEVKASLEEGMRRNLITTNVAYARDRLGGIDARIATDRASLAGEKRTVLAGNDGAAARRLAEAYFGYGEYAGGDRALPRGAAEGRGRSRTWSTPGSGRRWRSPGSGRRRRRRSAR